MSRTKIEILLNKILSDHKVYFYTIDHLLKKIVIFSDKYILDVSLVDRGGFVKKTNLIYFYIRKFEDIDKVYNFMNEGNINSVGLSKIINTLIKYDKLIYKLFKEENNLFYKNTFNKISTSKNILYILKGGGLEEVIEKSFIGFCNNSGLNLTVLYRFGTGYWGQTLNQDGFFNELKASNPRVKFIYKEDYDDSYIDTLIDDNTEIFSFQYDYKGKNKDLNMIVLSSVTDKKIDCLRYKNIFSCYESKSIGYSTDKFINTDHLNVYKIFNPQDINMLRSYNILTDIKYYILSGGMQWCRDFSIINSLKGEYKGLMVSDEEHHVNNFLDMYRGIQSYHGFFGAFALSKFFIACHVEEFNDDDRSKMIATAICSGKPVVIPYNEGEIVKTVISNGLGITYENGNEKDFVDKVNFFAKNEKNILEYGERCLNYSNKNMDINKFMNLIFSKVFDN